MKKFSTKVCALFLLTGLASFGGFAYDDYEAPESAPVEVEDQGFYSEESYDYEAEADTLAQPMGLDEWEEPSEEYSDY